MFGADQESVLNVRVLLDSYPLKENVAIEIFSEKGIIVSDSREPYKKYFFDDLAMFRLNGGTLSINNKREESQIVRITPINGYVEYNGNKYRGTFYTYHTKNTLDIINVLPLEDYIYSVLKTEGWPGWPKEVYKVFAIACRSYVLYQVRQAKRQKRHYHIYATNQHQTYSGTHSSEVIRQAVDETFGVFLSYRNEPILAMFDACCGGLIPAKIRNGVNFAQAPYLARSYPCTYCKDFKIFSWTKDISVSKFIQTVQATFPTLESIDDIYTVTDAAGVVQKIVIEDGYDEYKLDGKKVYSLFPSIKSFAYTCKKRRGNITFKGVGFGHHLGLCQWGAREMVNQGWSYKKILKFYYPGTTFMKLYKKPAPTTGPEESAAQTESVPVVHEASPA
jgi:stage II sporulation protein D